LPNQSVVRETCMNSTEGGRRENKVTAWREHAFKVVLPRRLSEHTESDLKLMLVSLKNARVASSVHIQRIERELKKRGCSLTVMGRR